LHLVVIGILVVLHAVKYEVAVRLSSPTQLELLLIRPTVDVSVVESHTYLLDTSDSVRLPAGRHTLYCPDVGTLSEYSNIGKALPHHVSRSLTNTGFVVVT